jgi:2-amino-4-hydroxy-6-hydroxymethyldihydropteridine diphosphokinase
MTDVLLKSIPIALSLGSNLGDRLAALKYAISRLSTVIPHIVCSPIYETEPVGYTEQPAFLNCACIGHTEHSIEAILDLISVIHGELHRKPRPKWHEREIDIDILLYGDAIIHAEHMIIPHPRMHERAFVLQPLSNIAPEMMHPEKNQTIAALYDQCNDDAGIALFCEAIQL